MYGSAELEKEEVSLRADVPYCMWNNRGRGEMLVWHQRCGYDSIRQINFKTVNVYSGQAKPL
ncbi:MAG: hypothetical protein ACLRIP_11185 [Blautia massiliensis (ex Durand et al. 2017)]